MRSHSTTLAGLGVLLLPVVWSACSASTYEVSELQDAGAQDAGAVGDPDFPVTGIGSNALGVTGIEPASGPFAGGTAVVVRGSGFVEGAEVFIGGRRAEPVTTVVSGKGRIELIVPAGDVGAADVSVEIDDKRVTLRDAFLYNALQITPDRGSVAGGTLIEVTVSGGTFDDTTVVEIDGRRCGEPRVVSPTRVRCKTPKHLEGRVSVTATGAGEVSERFEAKDAFEFVDFADTDRGGLSGGPIAGTLDVTVLDAAAGFRLPGAFVLVGNDAAGPHQGLTDERGSITFSATDLRGPVTVHAALECYERSSIVSFDASSATLFLMPILDFECMSDAEPGNGHGVLGSFVAGELVFPGADEFEINAWDIVPKPRAGEVRVAYVYTTQTSVDDDNPPTDVEGAMARLEEGSATRGKRGFEYRIFARPAGLAVYAVAGIERTRDGDFTPYVMGVARNVVTSPGDETLGVDIEMEITLDRQLSITLDGVPKAVQGQPNEYRVRALVDLGGEGLIVPQTERGLMASLASPTLGAFRFLGQPAFVGSLADASYEIAAGYYTRGAEVPYTELRRVGVQPSAASIPLSGFLAIPTLVTPAPGAALPADRTLRFEIQGKAPDLFVVEILGGDGNPAWFQILPGTAREVPIPDLSAIAAQTDIAAGNVVWQVSALSVDDFAYDAFQYSQLSERYVTASAAHASVMRR
jgi:IPT/TIG domain